MRKKQLRAVIITSLIISILFSGCGASNNLSVTDNSEKNSKTEATTATEDENLSTESATEKTTEATTTEELTEEENTTEDTSGESFSDTLDITTEDGVASASFYAFDTYTSVTAYGEDAEAALRSSADMIDSMNSKLNSTQVGTEIYKLNEAGESSDCSEDLKNVISEGIDYYKETNGALNFALYPLSVAWGFRNTGDFRVPSDEEITELLQLAEPEKIDLSDGVRYEKDGMKTDLFYLAKGYTSDKVSEMLCSDYTDGLSGALITLGGNVTAIGSKPDGKPWKVGIQNPDGESGSYIAVVSLNLEAGSSLSVCSDGIYEDSFEQDGTVYYHLIDPETGYPADSGIVSATAVSEDASLADAFASASVVMGYDKAIELWKTSSRDFDLILVDINGTIYVTEGMAENVSSSTNQIQIISKN